MTVRITPSILNADFADMGREVGRIESADGVHIDVMDNHFVPNLTMGVPMVEALRKVSDLPFDAHLMIEDPDVWAPGYVDAGAQTVTFHLEAAKAPIRLAREIRSRGGRAAVALKPATPVEQIADFLDEFDQVLLMTVEPGFGGQSFLDCVLPKIRRTRELIDRTGKDIWLQVDGGVSPRTIARAAQAGADTFVAGSAVYRAEAPDEAVQRLRNLATRATA
ncbi:Ribulose-phosphate 3-epimerase [Cutibacterium granulosum]|uniref:Ribulose-phosphate 3-epimerase n=3 Tax=Cutibacterium granulosum TaxID=33011 RepID=U1GN83_9ACTN|nr:ribulose-phosphate 3-epimerase [Cutibacterium granulosum]MDU1779385.1 ribulose-phosphate 3-epimerase [Propionibacterium sp.]ERF58169.1 ribulose-phosphate 3-epimerase [Cutibacterium granulosum DSM 20700]ERF67052.1 Ribulose-phosphate 3-epimerase [Cutibacterium granulosum TM11]KAG9059645.1 ribulose-phosphate 3-epimerase [Cutibacterium granulosum DSM 20700]MBS5253923.1 ribulose-phosphate 3-epimerase [Cutibacterium granulosum]